MRYYQFIILIVLLRSIVEGRFLFIFDYSEYIKEKDYYLVSKILEIGIDDTLLINEGSSIAFAPMCGIDVKGTLLIKGTSENIVHITSQRVYDKKGASSFDWRGIEIYQQGTVEVEYTEIENAAYGLKACCNGIIGKRVKFRNIGSVPVYNNDRDQLINQDRWVDINLPRDEEINLLDDKRYKDENDSNIYSKDIPLFKSEKELSWNKYKYPVYGLLSISLLSFGYSYYNQIKADHYYNQMRSAVDENSRYYYMRKMNRYSDRRDDGFYGGVGVSLLGVSLFGLTMKDMKILYVSTLIASSTLLGISYFNNNRISDISNDRERYNTTRIRDICFYGGITAGSIGVLSLMIDL